MLNPALMTIIDRNIRQDVHDAVGMLVGELDRVLQFETLYADLLAENHPYWASAESVDTGLAIDPKVLDIVAGYLLYFMHGESFGGRGGMAPQISNDVVWLTLSKGLLSGSVDYDGVGEAVVKVDDAPLADIVFKVTVESVLKSLKCSSMYSAGEASSEGEIEDAGAEVAIRPGDKNPRCWNITSDDFSFAVGLLLFVLSTNPFCSTDTRLVEGCATILDSGSRNDAVAVGLLFD